MYRSSMIKTRLLDFALVVSILAVCTVFVLV